MRACRLVVKPCWACRWWKLPGFFYKNYHQFRTVLNSVKLHNWILYSPSRMLSQRDWFGSLSLSFFSSNSLLQPVKIVLNFGSVHSTYYLAAGWHWNIEFKNIPPYTWLRNQEATVSVNPTDVSWCVGSWRMDTEINNIVENLPFPQSCLPSRVATKRGRKMDPVSIMLSKFLVNNDHLRNITVRVHKLQV